MNVSRSILVMALWLVLSGCDDDDGEKKGEPGTGTVTIVSQNVGCSGKVTGLDVEDSQGNRGKASINWNFVTLMGALSVALLFCCVRNNNHTRSRSHQSVEV